MWSRWVELCWLVILLDLNQEEAAAMSVCLCSLFCIVLVMLETLTKLKHLLVSSSFIRQPANHSFSLCLHQSVSLSPSPCAAFTYSPWFQWLCAGVLSLSLSLSPLSLSSPSPPSLSLSLSLSPLCASLSICLFSLSLYPPSNLSVSLHTHLFYFQYKQLSFIFPHALRLQPRSYFGRGRWVYLSSLIDRIPSPETYCAEACLNSNYPLINDSFVGVFFSIFYLTNRSR